MKGPTPREARSARGADEQHQPGSSHPMLAGSERIVFPLDVASLSEARAWLARLSGHVGVMKVGLELFSRAGPDAVRAVHEAGSTCFLDLKLHDIPETVARAASAAAEIGVAFLTVHASGGAAMLDRARRAVAGARTTLLAVTVLTSLDAAQLEAVGLAGPPREAVLRLARLARDSGCGGLVASPLELSALRADLGPELVIATPGVRPAGSAQHDQRRVATPAEATRAGASLLVIGRPIRDAPDPVAAAAAIANEIAGALG